VECAYRKILEKTLGDLMNIRNFTFYSFIKCTGKYLKLGYVSLVRSGHVRLRWI